MDKYKEEKSSTKEEAAKEIVCLSTDSENPMHQEVSLFVNLAIAVWNMRNTNSFFFKLIIK